MAILAPVSEAVCLWMQVTKNHEWYCVHVQFVGLPETSQISHSGNRMLDYKTLWFDPAGLFLCQKTGIRYSSQLSMPSLPNLLSLLHHNRTALFHSPDCVPVPFSRKHIELCFLKTPRQWTFPSSVHVFIALKGHIWLWEISLMTCHWNEISAVQTWFTDIILFCCTRKHWGWFS